MSRTTYILCALAMTVILATVSTSALAGTVYLAGGDTTLYRVVPTGGSGYTVEEFDLGIELHGMHYDAASDTVLVLSNSGAAPSHATIYALANATSGTPSLSTYSVLSHRYGGFTKAGNDFFAFDQGNLWRINLSDPGNPSEEYVGDTGVLYTAGAAYDPATSVLYMLSAATDNLYAVDAATATATPLGHFGIDAVDLGAEWFNGKLYATMQNNDVEELQIGLVDAATGLYSSMFTLDAPAHAYATSLAIVPEPGTAMLLGALALALYRRR